MYLPDFLFEDEDIDYLRNEGIFLTSFVEKNTDTVYFKINVRKLNELIDLLYRNISIDDKDRSDVEFDIRTVANIFTAIINKANRMEIVNSILSYHRINPMNAKRLLTCVRYDYE